MLNYIYKLTSTTVLLLVLGTSSKPQEVPYQDIIQNIQLSRERIHLSYAYSDSAQICHLIDSTRNSIFSYLTDSIIPYWYGTQWSFEGMTRTPQQGSIACGYFVNTVLLDAGFNIPRIRWSQLASETEISKLCGSNVKRFWNTPMAEVEQFLKNSGNGIYMVGLDMHVGFIVVRNSNISFIHSNYYSPSEGVMSQSIFQESPLTYSKYRVIGKLLSNQMIINWITNKEYQ